MGFAPLYPSYSYYEALDASIVTTVVPQGVPQGMPARVDV